MDDKRGRLLPPMSALQGFVAAAENGGISAAGRAIGRTQGAVSRQVALLENWLGTSLFNRVGKEVQLTRQGRDYLAAIRPALDDIRNATLRAMEQSAKSELTIATLPGFGMRWLAPRLSNLARCHPDIMVNFAARSRSFDLRGEQFHAGIHFGQPDWPGASHDLLFSEEMVPVVAPQLLESRRVARPEDLLSLPLLGLESRPNAWRAWFENVGVSQTVPLPFSVFEHFMMLAQAAVAGVGAALIPSFLIEDELRSGALTRPFPSEAPQSGSYYFVYYPDQLRSKTFCRFRSWLLAEAQAFAAASGVSIL